jgi:hypothetical protein
VDIVNILRVNKKKSGAPSRLEASANGLTPFDLARNFLGLALRGTCLANGYVLLGVPPVGARVTEAAVFSDPAWLAVMFQRNHAA